MPGDALVFRGEDKVSYRLSWDELHALVSRAQQALKAEGVGKGDRVAAMLPNLPESIALMLAVTSLGAIWSSCSPDFGERGVLDRFGQIEPKVFIAVDGYWYNGKSIDLASRLTAIAKELPTAQKVVIVPYLKTAEKVAAAVARAVTLDGFLQQFRGNAGHLRADAVQPPRLYPVSPPAPPACRNASCMAVAARCCNI